MPHWIIHCSAWIHPHQHKDHIVHLPLSRRDRLRTFSYRQLWQIDFILEGRGFSPTFLWLPEGSRWKVRERLREEMWALCVALVQTHYTGGSRLQHVIITLRQTNSLHLIRGWNKWQWLPAVWLKFPQTDSKSSGPPRFSGTKRWRGNGTSSFTPRIPFSHFPTFPSLS